MAAGPQAVPLSSPPPPPEVTQQQNPGQMSQFASRFQDQGQAPGNAPKELVKQKMSQVAQMLTDVAKVLSTTDPSSMPLLKRMVEAGAMLMRNMEQTQGSGQAEYPNKPPEAQGEGGQAEGATPGM